MSWFESVCRCMRGNLVEFQLQPVWSTKDNYFCHIEPVARQHLIALEYTIMHYHSTLFRGNISIYANDDWKKTGRISRR
jgi:hypothetical protein